MKKFFRSIYWKISATFLALLLILSAVYIYIIVFSAEMYFQEANQRLSVPIAQRLLKHYQPVVNHQLDSSRMDEIYTIQKLFNPSIEVYVLDTTGKVLSHCPSNTKICRMSVGIQPIKTFVMEKFPSFLMGDDPKYEMTEKTFSAAEIKDGTKIIGYLYVILGSEEFDNNFKMLAGSYILRIGTRTMTITLFAAAIIGLIALLFITKNLRTIVRTVKEFQNGNRSARIQLSSTGELNELATSFNEMADTIVSNLDELKTMDSLRRELVANVSHDLRTPLATIHGYIETLLIKAETLENHDREKYLKTILSSTDRLRTLVEELFELSKLEAQQIKPNPEPFSISELVQDIGQKYLIIAEKKEIRFQCILPHDLPLVIADIALVDRVIQNLSDNAIKFTPQGGVVTIEVRRNLTNVEVTVADTGEGIFEKDIPHIFDRYNKGSQKNIFQSDGAGLGLAIVKKILEVHHLSISVSSKKNEGTAFSFKLPVYPV
ncbi:MAG: HAMP domain-containing sensor histidine kinase [Bacteroidota bacterium]|nr:HAMP domain-containing sensor histidine kinase [Bacteroidota bacterium]